MAARQDAVIRSFVAAAWCALVATVFWTQSRWPALDRKLVMGAGGRAEIRGLGFDHWWVVDPDGALWARIAGVFVNWCYANRYGMAFGLVFAAAFVTFLGTLPRVRPRSRILGALLGTVVGAPLGVCANCVAPIGSGLAASGERTETVLATMVASPTLNPAVLGLLFSLFPSSMWVPRLIGLALLLVVLVPWIAGAEPRPAPRNIDLLSPAGTPVRDVIRGFVAQFAYILATTLPWMFVAGLLGATVVVLVPPESLVGLEGLGPVIVASLIGTFLPVPITFDVVLVATLMGAGLSVGPAAALLATLGTWSVYGAIIARAALGTATSARMTLAVFLLGVGVGLVSQAADDDLGAAAQESAIPTRSQRIAPHLTAVCGSSGSPEMCSGSVAGLLALRERNESLCSLAGSPTGIARCQLNARTDSRRGGALTIPDLREPCLIVASGDPDGCVLSAVVASGRNGLCGATAAPGVCRAEIAAAESFDSGHCAGQPAEVVACEREAVIALASGSRNPALCDVLDPTSRRRCEVGVWLRAGRESADPYACGRISALGDGEAALACAQFQAVGDAVRSGDPGQCLASSDPTACLQWQVQNPRSMADHILSRLGALPEPVSADPPWGQLPVSQRPSPSGHDDGERLHGPNGVEVLRIPLAVPKKGTPQFERMSGRDFGLDLDRLDATQLHEPFAFGRGLTSGDIDNDGDVDLVFGARGGVAVFHNRGDGRFIQVAGPAATHGLDVMGVQLVDMDGRPGLDLWVRAYGGVVGWVGNDGLGFSDGILNAIPSTGRILAMGQGVADVDRDGDLDVVLGNWSFGAATSFDAERDADELWLNEGEGTWRRGLLDDVAGETLSTLLTDTDGDGVIELMSANDGPGPDQWFQFANGRFDAVRRGDTGAPPRTSWFSMSYDSGDVDGDGRLDIVSADMSFPTPVMDSVCVAVPLGDQEACRSLVEDAAAVRNLDAKACGNDACRMGVLLHYAVTHDRSDLCVSLAWREAAALCEARTARTPRPDRAEPSAGYLPQVERNLALRRTDAGFEDMSAVWGLRGTSWTWNLRLVDIDADGGLDVHAGNGYVFSGPFPGDAHADVTLQWSGDHWTDVSAAWGLDDAGHTPAFVFADLDGDGDVDRVSTSPVAGPSIAWNRGGSGHRLVVRVNAGTNNTSGVGARVFATVGGRRFVRELKVGGGFLSSEAPEAVFGLGEHDSVDEVRLRWPDGGEVSLGAVQGDALLLVTRTSRSQP